MGWLYRILDVGRGVELAVKDAEKVNGSAAIATALFFDLLLAIIFGWAWWTYDLYSTWAWAGPLGAGWGGKLPKNLQPYNQWLVFVLNAAPTLIQWRFPRLARKHDAYLWLFALAAVFDMITDYPAVRSDIDLYLGAIIAQLGEPLAFVVRWGAYFAGTVLASFVLQAIVVMQLAKVLALLARAGDSRRPRRGAEAAE